MPCFDGCYAVATFRIVTFWIGSYSSEYDTTLHSSPVLVNNLQMALATIVFFVIKILLLTVFPSIACLDGNDAMMRRSEGNKTCDCLILYEDKTFNRPNIFKIYLSEVISSIIFWFISVVDRDIHIIIVDSVFCLQCCNLRLFVALALVS